MHENMLLTMACFSCYSVHDAMNHQDVGCRAMSEEIALAGELESGVDEVRVVIGKFKF